MPPKRKHLYKPDDITTETITVPAKQLKQLKPVVSATTKTKGRAGLVRKMADILLDSYGEDKLKKKYLGWFRVEGEMYPRPYLHWADVVDESNKKYTVYHPLQVKLAAFFFKTLRGDALTACKSAFKSLEDLVWKENIQENPEFMLVTVTRKGRKYVAPRYTYAQLSYAILRKTIPITTPLKNKRKRPSVSGKDKKSGGGVKTKRSKKRNGVNADALRELRQGQGTLDESIFDTAAAAAATNSKKKNKKRSRPKKKSSMATEAPKKKKQKKVMAPLVHTKDRWGYLNKQILAHWSKASFSRQDTENWSKRVFVAKQQPVMKVPVAVGKTPPVVTFDDSFPTSDISTTRGKEAHAMENPLSFTKDHSFIAEGVDVQWAVTAAAATSIRPTAPPPTMKSSLPSTALVRKTSPAPVAAPASPSLPVIVIPTPEMKHWSFAYENTSTSSTTTTSSSHGANQQRYAPHMLLYAQIGELETDVISKYRVKHVENPGIIRVLSRLREWLIRHNHWNTVLQYDPWCNIEKELKSLRPDSKSEYTGKLFICILNHLKTSDPVDLYYEYHDMVLKQLENAVADKGDAIKAVVVRARTIFNSLSKIQNPTRDLAASVRGFQGKRQDVLWSLVHCMLVLKAETVTQGWRDIAARSSLSAENGDLHDENSMLSFSNSCSGSSSPDVQHNTEWHRNRFTWAAMQIWDDMRNNDNFFSHIQSFMQERGFKTIKTISDFMAPGPHGLGRGRFRFYVLNTFNHLFPHGSPETDLSRMPISEEQRVEEDQQFQNLARQLTKAFGLSSKDYLKEI